MDKASFEIISTTALWVMAMWSLVFTIVICAALAPLGSAAYRIMHHSLAGRDASREWGTAFDKIYLRLNIALAKPWAVVLLFASLTLMGAGYGFGAGGDVAILVSDKSYTWLPSIDRYLDWVSTIGACAGMAGILASISNRPRASVLMSLGFTMAGIGIGVTSQQYF